MKRAIKLYLTVGLTLLWPLIGYGQIADEEPITEIVFKESQFYVPIDRGIHDTVHVYFHYELGDRISVRQSLPFDSWDAIEFEFLPFNFIRDNDTIWFAQFNPLSKEMELEPAYPLQVGDTIEYSGCHLNMLDSTVKKDSSYDLKVVSCHGNSREVMTVYSGDTTVSILGRKLNCHIFTQFDEFSHGNRRRSSIRRRILFSIDLMVPVDIVENYYYVSSGRVLLTIPRHQWLVSRRMKAILFR